MSSPVSLYNNLGDVYDASKTVQSKAEALDTLAKLLVSHNLHNSYNIRLNHKHFDIAEGEQVVGFPGQDMMVSTICKNGQVPREFLQQSGIQPVSHGKIVPSDYFISDDGKATPYEFLYTATDHAGATLDGSFLNEWSSILHQNGLSGLLGLSVQEESAPDNSHEVSDSETRVNKLFYGESPEAGMSYVSTTWRVEESGGLINLKQCSFCNQIQRHGNKC